MSFSHVAYDACVFAPAVQCSGKGQGFDKNEHVSKFVLDGEFDSEVETNEMLREIPNIEKHVVFNSSCKVSGKEQKLAKQICKPQGKQTKYTGSFERQLYSERGTAFNVWAKPFHYLDQKTGEYNQGLWTPETLRKMKNIVDALRLIHEHKWTTKKGTHIKLKFPSDELHAGNVVIDSHGIFRLIDFGSMHKIEIQRGNKELEDDDSDDDDFDLYPRNVGNAFYRKFLVLYGWKDRPMALGDGMFDLSYQINHVRTLERLKKVFEDAALALEKVGPTKEK